MTFGDKIAKLEAREAQHRHRVNNQRQLIYSLLHLFDLPAGQRKNMLAGIRSDLATLEQAEALEKGIVATAGIAGGPAE